MNKEKFIKQEADILHIFADTGIECEVLTMYGDVTRVGIEPEENPYTENLIKADATEIEFEQNTFDLSVWHPPCQRWSMSTQGSVSSKEDFPNYIPIAREKAKKFSDEYLIENVPQAPLEDPVMLNGKMFGLPYSYERAFETSWHVPQPERSWNKLPDVSCWDADRGDSSRAWIGNKRLWCNAKGYTHDWDAVAIRKSAIPRPYLNYLLRPIIDDWAETSRSSKPKTQKIGRDKGLFDY